MAAAATTAPVAKTLPKPAKAWSSTVTLTFGDVAENHRGMQKIGEKASVGLEEKDLLEAKSAFEKLGCKCELINLCAFAPKDATQEGGKDEGAALEFEGAWFLVIRGGVKAFTDPDALYAEQMALTWDSKALMYGEVREKHARHNLCYGDEAQAPDYANGEGTVVAYKTIPHTKAVKEGLPTLFGEKAQDLKCEGNLYHTPGKCGIGYHGDSERRIAIGVRLGGGMPLVFRWFYRGKPMGEEVRLILHHGDMYAMSAKAVGTDWRRKVVSTLRHAAGCEKFTKLD